MNQLNGLAYNHEQKSNRHRHPSDNTRGKKKRIGYLAVTLACLRGGSLAWCRGRHSGGSQIIFAMVMGNDQGRFSVHCGHI